MADEEVDQYLRARQEYLERNRDILLAERRWRLFGIVSAMTACIAVAGLVLMATQNRFVPYVIELDKQAEIVRQYPFEPHVGPVSNEMSRAFLARWVRTWRTVTPDLSLIPQQAQFVYALIDSSSAAQRTITEWYRANVPHTRARTETTNIQVQNVLRLSTESWRLEWLEQTRLRSGELSKTELYTATVRIRQGQVDEGIALQNPIGMYITDVDWSLILE